MTILARKRQTLPGLGLTLGYSLLYLSLIVLIPLSTLFWQSSHLSHSAFVSTMTDPDTLAAFRLTFGASFVAALVNVVFGVPVAWVLARYRFPGRRLIDSLVDLPFALPTAVAGISLSTLYGPDGWIGKHLEAHGIHVVNTSLGVTVALIFISLPFVVRTVQPVLEDMDPDNEEAAANLGASRWQTLRRVVLPPLIPVVVTGFVLAFARALGEYGSVVFISGGIPGVSQIVPHLIYNKLEEFDYPGATAIAAVMLVASFAILLLINMLQWLVRRRQGAG